MVTGDGETSTTRGLSIVSMETEGGNKMERIRKIVKFTYRHSIRSGRLNVVSCLKTAMEII